MRIKYGGSATIEEVTVEQNVGDGVYNEDESYVTCNRCTIRQNGGDGIGGDAYSRLTINGCEIVNNDGSATNPNELTPVKIRDSVVVGNGGAVRFTPYFGSVLSNTEIRESDRAGVFAGHPGNNFLEEPSPIRNCTIQDNDGSGIDYEDSFVEISCCRIERNNVGYKASMIGRSESKLRHNNIQNNSGYGVLVEHPRAIEEPVEAECNYWGHATGPDHEDNPRKNPKGDAVSDHGKFKPWSVREIEGAKPRVQVE